MSGRAQIGGIPRNFAKDNRKGGQTVSESLNYSDAGAVRRPDYIASIHATRSGGYCGGICWPRWSPFKGIAWSSVRHGRDF